MAIMMSVPSVRVVRQLSLSWGRASTIIRHATATMRSTNSRWRAHCFHDEGSLAKGAVVLSAMYGRALRCLSMYHTIRGT